MSFKGPAENDLGVMLSVLPREFTTEQAVQATGWETKKVRQAIVMGVSQDKLLPRDIENNFKMYESIAWRKEWVTKPWLA